jgi:hypothetical protein
MPVGTVEQHLGERVQLTRSVHARPDGTRYYFNYEVDRTGRDGHIAMV